MLKHSVLWALYNPVDCSGSTQIAMVSISMSLMSQSLDRASPRDTTFPPANAEEFDTVSPPNFDSFPALYTCFSLYASACDHMMHLDCSPVYNSSICQRHCSHVTRNYPENIQRKEHICPLCKSSSNVLLVLNAPVSQTPFPDWIRAVASRMLYSGTGEFVFWSAQDISYGGNAVRKPEAVALTKMLDTLMLTSRMFQQTRHLREHPEPEVGERGAEMYLPKNLVGYTISAIEVAARDASGRTRRHYRIRKAE
jgi:E3 ubiquitin-protein ligase UBR1